MKLGKCRCQIPSRRGQLLPQESFVEFDGRRSWELKYCLLTRSRGREGASLRAQGFTLPRPIPCDEDDVFDVTA